MNTFHVIGLMSGTSLDGVDLAYCTFTASAGNWIYKILNTTTLEYTANWIFRLSTLNKASGLDFVATDHEYGKYLGDLINDFVKANNLHVDFVASHGHTIFHEPSRHISWQLGHGAYIAAAAGLPVICDFRTLDIALGGQGAPLVPIGDQLLFPEYDFCLNLGGIANISFQQDDKRVAYDICACNMLLNDLAGKIGKPYDINGEMARNGNLDRGLFAELNAPAYFTANFPKSLGKEWADQHSLKTLEHSPATIPDKLHTTCHHIAFQIAEAVKTVDKSGQKLKMLVTGGGAFNAFLVELIREYLGENLAVIVPEPELVSFKEALVFAFLGVLRWNQKPNCLRSVTGSSQNNVGGAIWQPFSDSL